MNTASAIFEKDFVEDLLPQKFPFVMVDKMFSFTETTIVTGLEIKSDNIFYDGGTFREPGLVEHMAQSVALHTGYEFFLRKETAPTGYIGSISGVEIKQLPVMGDQIQTTVTILQEFGGITMVEITTTLNGETIASGQMKTVLAK
jgi:3-hydroxymyristoyl/3-hydroxydecanoyl-(acyl carrier protein) dehydratase